MITREDVMPLLLDACPSFTESWLAVKQENTVDEPPGGRLHYMDAGVFIRHLVTLRLAKATSEFPSVFAVINRLVVER